MPIRWKLRDREGVINRRWSTVSIAGDDAAIAFEVGPSMSLWVRALSPLVRVRLAGVDVTGPYQITSDTCFTLTFERQDSELQVLGVPSNGLVPFGALKPFHAEPAPPDDRLREAIGAMTAAHSPALLYRVAERWRTHAVATIGRWLVNKGVGAAVPLEHKASRSVLEPVVWALLRAEPSRFEWADVLALFLDAETRRYAGRLESNMGGFAVTQAPALALEVAREHCDLLVHKMLEWMALFDPALVPDEVQHYIAESSVALSEALEAASSIEGLLQDASGEIIDGDLVLSRDAVDARFPALTAVRGSIRAINCESLLRLDLPNLRAVRGIVIEGSPLLFRVNLPELTTALGDVVMRNNASLVSVAMPKLEALRAVVLESNPLIDAKSLAELERLGNGMVTVTGTTSGELDATAHLDALISRAWADRGLRARLRPLFQIAPSAPLARLAFFDAMLEGDKAACLQAAQRWLLFLKSEPPAEAIRLFQEGLAGRRLLPELHGELEVRPVPAPTTGAWGSTLDRRVAALKPDVKLALHTRLVNQMLGAHIPEVLALGRLQLISTWIEANMAAKTELTAFVAGFVPILPERLRELLAPVSTLLNEPGAPVGTVLAAAFGRWGNPEMVRRARAAVEAVVERGEREGDETSPAGLVSPGAQVLSDGQGRA